MLTKPKPKHKLPPKCRFYFQKDLFNKKFTTRLPTFPQRRYVSEIVMDEVRDILPSKGQTRLYLFQHRIPHSYQTVLKSYAACLGSNDAPLPKGIKGRI